MTSNGSTSGPGNSFRKGLPLPELFKMFPDDRTAEAWFAEMRWGSMDAQCPFCASGNVQERPTRKPQPYRCRACRKDFSVKTGTLMQSSNLGCQKWAIAIYLLTSSLKGVSSMKLHRDLGITQKSAWHLAHRIRSAWAEDKDRFAGPVEADETYIGGIEANKHPSKKLHAGRGTVGKVAVLGVKDRETNKIHAEPVDRTDAPALVPVVRQRMIPGARLFTDGNTAYPMKHEIVRHSVGEYVRGQVHTNGIESFWSVLKRGYHGVYHRMSFKHLVRYVKEFEGRHNHRCEDTVDQMAGLARNMFGKRLRYRDLVA